MHEADKGYMPKLALKLKENLRAKLLAVNFDLEMSECIKAHKLELLANLIEEQNFRIKLNSIGNKQDAVEKMLAQHTSMM